MTWVAKSVAGCARVTMPKLDHLWPIVVSFENLWCAWRKARRGKSRTDCVARFELNLEHELLDLQRELIAGHYQPGLYRLFTLYERKPRQIAAAPFRDRVVHHAVMNVIEPPLDRHFIPQSYACRLGKGVHAAANQYQHWAKRYAYALKIDVQKYFPSIDHSMLLDKLKQRIADQPLLDLLERIITGSPEPLEPTTHLFPNDDLLTLMQRRRGIPIGNLTSQFFANLYLDEFDHWVKKQLHVTAYLRYVDDMVLLSDDKRQLRAWRVAIEQRLAEERLRLHPHKAQITPTRCGLNLLGYHVWPHRRRLANHNGYRFRRRLRRLARNYAAGHIELADIDPSVQAWIGHARHADTLALRETLFNEIIFTRG